MSDDAFKTVRINVKKDLFDDKKEKGACLIIINGPDLGKVYVIDRPMMLLGREEGMDIRINDAHVSRRHAQFLKKDDEITLIDLQSTNGTFVNDEKIVSRVLKDEDKILVGDITLKFISKNDIETAFHEELYQLASHDGLTEVFNKMYFLKTLEERKDKKPFSLIMFDIDFFKKVNDTYGHTAGDFILKEFAELVKRTIREEDVFARFGGEEFIMLMPVPKEVAVNVAERIRQMIEAHDFSFEGRVIKCTISGGVYFVADFSLGVQQWITQVDKLLYQAKAEGRNKICS